MNTREHLFHRGELSEVLDGKKRDISCEIDGYQRNYILNVSPDDLLNHLEDKYRCDSPVLRIDQASIINHGEAEIDVRYDQRRWIDDKSKPFYVKGTFVEFAVPFDGDAELFGYRTNPFTHNPPTGNIVGSELRLKYETTDHNPEEIKKEYQRNVAEIQRWLVWVTQQVDVYNASLKSFIQQCIDKRRKKHLADQGMVAALGFPVKQRDGASTTYSMPVTKKKLAVLKPSPSSVPFKPEPQLDMDAYEDILKAIADMAIVMERNPSAFKTMGEEPLRDSLLIPLNNRFEIPASGETFNFHGKTDILIRAEDRNLFVGECKIWKGEKVLTQTIDQILGYTSWRDTKTAIILFNRNKDLSSVLSKIPEVIKQHQNFKRQVSYPSESGFRFVFHHNDDKNRELILTVLVMEVPS